MIEYEKNLHDFVEKISAEAKEKQFAYLFIAASSEHAEFKVNPFPAWSCLSVEDSDQGPAIRIRAASSKGDNPRLESSMHALLSMRDLCVHNAAVLMKMSDDISALLRSNGVEIEHVAIHDREETGVEN